MKALKMEITEKGLTLIDLIIALAIIGILASIASPLFAASRVKAFDDAAKADLNNAMKVIDLYVTDNDTFPATVDELIAAGFKQSENVTFTRFDVHTFVDGQQTVHMHVQYAGSSNEWHVNYPMGGSEIEIR